MTRGARMRVAGALVAVALLVGGCASGPRSSSGGSTPPSAPAAQPAVLDAYAQVQREVDAAVQSAGPTAVEAALAASTAQVAKEADIASDLGREIRLRITAADSGGSAAASGCAILWVRGFATYWRGFGCATASTGPEVALPDGQAPPTTELPNGPLTVPSSEFTAIMAALPATITALDAHAQVEDAMRTLAGPGPLPRVETQLRAAADGGVDIAVAAFSYADRACILARRIDGAVEVWRPAKVQVQPGEGSCDSWEAMAGLMMHPPH